MLILAWLSLSYYSFFISNYYFYKTDSEHEKNIYSMQFIETIGAFLLGGSTWKIKTPIKGFPD